MNRDAIPDASASVQIFLLVGLGPIQPVTDAGCRCGEQPVFKYDIVVYHTSPLAFQRSMSEILHAITGRVLLHLQHQGWYSLVYVG